MRQSKLFHNKTNADAMASAFKISLTALYLVPFLNVLSNYYNSKRVDVLGRKYVSGPSQNFIEMILSWAKNIFTSANINSIVIGFSNNLGSGPSNG